MTHELICLIASHINCDERASNFLELLNMINNQQNCLKKNIYISMSNEIDIDVSNIKNKINEYNFHMIYNNIKLSQFEHYNKLIKTIVINDPKNTWIIFSDDDDIWSENRLSTISCCLNDNELSDNLGCLIIPSYELYDGKTVPCDNMNYVDLCIRYKYVKLFFDNVNENVLKHKFCDVFFLNILMHYGNIHKIDNQIKCKIPLYIWRHVDYKRACASLTSSKKHENDVYIELGFENVIISDFDLYMAVWSRTEEKSFNNFINLLTIKNNNSYDKKEHKIIRKIFNKNYKNHIFNFNLPEYIPEN